VSKNPGCTLRQIVVNCHCNHQRVSELVRAGLLHRTTFKRGESLYGALKVSTAVVTERPSVKIRIWVYQHERDKTFFRSFCESGDQYTHHDGVEGMRLIIKKTLRLPIPDAPVERMDDGDIIDIEPERIG
jgi:hypothetical protein